jgi:hypothetical protein
MAVEWGAELRGHLGRRVHAGHGGRAMEVASIRTRRPRRTPGSTRASPCPPGRPGAVGRDKPAGARRHIPRLTVVLPGLRGSRCRSRRHTGPGGRGGRPAARSALSFQGISVAELMQAMVEVVSLRAPLSCCMPGSTRASPCPIWPTSHRSPRQGLDVLAGHCATSRRAARCLGFGIAARRDRIAGTSRQTGAELPPRSCRP